MTAPTLTLPPFAGDPHAKPACRATNVNPEWWFPPQGPYSWERRQANRICRSCPLRDPCLKWALDHDERYGIWAATSPNDRKRIRRCRDGRCHHPTHQPARPIGGDHP